MVIIDDKILSKQETVNLIIERDGDNCCICHLPLEDDKTLDHWIPLSKEGTWDLENLKLAHRKCNTYKGNRMPNEDGTLPPLKRELKAQQKAVRRSERPVICDECMSGRLLLPGEHCPICGSGAQPYMAPKALQVSPKECNHSTQNCWMCWLQLIPRVPAIVDVLDGEYSGQEDVLKFNE